VTAVGAIPWDDTFPGAVTVTDTDGTILYMNEKSRRTFERHGGAALIGTSVYPCHGEGSREKIRELLRTGGTNAYTIEKNGVKKLIFQAAWRKDGAVAGLVEISIEIPFEMPHFVRES
jgi:hypothetical protein